jgi:DNA polymerase-3 subunit beta
MKITIERDLFQKHLSHAAKFTSSRIGSGGGLQGVFCLVKEGVLHMYATNLNTSYHAKIAVQGEGSEQFLIESGKLIEFLTYLDNGPIEISLEKERAVFIQGKTKGAFSFIKNEDFPLPPPVTESGTLVDIKIFEKIISHVLFAASRDLSRPVLSGVNFIDKDGEMDIVATDGFRLSLFHFKNEDKMRPMLIPAEFLLELSRIAKDKKELRMSYLDAEKMVYFQAGEEGFYTRLIEGDFPPYERVIPGEKKTTVVVERQELIKKVKLISIFAREHSSIVVCSFKKGELVLAPKVESTADNSAAQEIVLEGEEMRVAFNFKFLLEFLNVMDKDEIIIELLRPDAPVVLRQKGDESFLHIIMPIRIQE